MTERGDGRSSFQTILMLMAIPLCGMAVFFLWQWLNGGITPEEAVRETKASVLTQGGRRSARGGERRTRGGERSADGGGAAGPGLRPPPSALRPETTLPLPRVTPKKQHRRHGAIVLIIDDLGFDGQPLERVMALDPNINAAILPNGTRAGEFARRLHDGGFEVLCHLPMQPRGGQRPGANAILTSMSDDEIARTTRANIDAIPYARGVNNHMGSLATSDRRVMESVLRALPAGMYFIDSRTAGGSVAAAVARELNVRTATRHVFLDDVATERAVRRQVAALAAAAEKRGLAIGIGHPHAVTLRVLEEMLPELRAQGFRFVRAGDAVR